MIDKPIYIYNNWSAYDELSDNLELTEELAMTQLEEMLRLRNASVRFDYYLMDAFWYSPDGGYRQWRKPHWPEGPDRWLDTCIAEGIKPGLWLSGNTLAKLEPIPEWLDSLDTENREMCMFYGGFLPHLLETIRIWYDRGVRIFKFDFMRFKAAPPILQGIFLPSEIYSQNQIALHNGLKFLRQQCPEIVFIGYNGFDEIETMTQTDLPFRRTTDLGWLEVFDSMYCGDPRPSDVPAMNFWRSVDVYSDHMVRYYEATGFPLSRIDSCSFMMGSTGTCYCRKSSAWQGMLALSLARGGKVNTYHGNLELLDDEQAHWFAKIQSLFDHFITNGKFSTFGGIPGQAEMYGFMAQATGGTLYTVVNPAQHENTLVLPKANGGKVLFCDSGFIPILESDSITLGAEQLAIIGTGRYNDPVYELGEQKDVSIPILCKPYPMEFKPESNKSFVLRVTPPFPGFLRVTAHQKDPRGLSKRSNKGESPPDGIKFDKIMAITAEQNGHAILVKINYDKAIWSGLSWAVGEISSKNIDPATPIIIRCSTSEKSEVTLDCALYQVEYKEKE
jgi:hypothetical protein